MPGQLIVAFSDEMEEVLLCTVLDMADNGGPESVAGRSAPAPCPLSSDEGEGNAGLPQSHAAVDGSTQDPASDVTMHDEDCGDENCMCTPFVPSLPVGHLMTAAVHPETVTHPLDFDHRETQEVCATAQCLVSNDPDAPSATVPPVSVLLNDNTSIVVADTHSAPSKWIDVEAILSPVVALHPCAARFNCPVGSEFHPSVDLDQSTGRLKLKVLAPTPLTCHLHRQQL